MDEEERLDEEEIGGLAGLPSQKVIKTRRVKLDENRSFEIRTIKTQRITPEGEILEESEIESKMLDCGHQTSDPTIVRVCGFCGCLVCKDCIVFCENPNCPHNCHSKGMSKHCAVEYPDEGEKVYYLCPDCANYFDLLENKEKFKKAFKRILGIKGRSEKTD